VVSDIDPRTREAADADLVQAVLRAASEVLPPGPGRGDPLPISRGLIEDSNEAEEGLRLVAWAIHDARVRVPAWVIEAIRDLTAGTIAGSELPPDLDDFAE
jgi:hypothetical protein